MEESTKGYLLPIQFYGPCVSKKIKTLIKKEYNTFPFVEDSKPVPFELQRLLGPTSIWNVFKKQAEALTFVKGKKCGLMTFAFQQTNGERLFLVAHPRWLWYYDSKKDPRYRCSYEIIPEYTVCKLYFDLEFEIGIKQYKDGIKMVDTFISIICCFIKTIFDIKIDKRFIIDLDSTTNSKFSRHLIFNLPNAAFRDNYNVGNFVKYVCKNIKSCIEQLDKDSNYSCDFMKECCLSGSSVMELLIMNSKGKLLLFCDEGVYTKNRHFRVFKSTKLGKNAPLILSKENIYQPDKTLSNFDEQIFLDSLISYVPNDNLRVLKFNDYMDNNNSFSLNETVRQLPAHDNCNISPFPKIDQFIQKFVEPGRIWRSNFFQTSNTVVYDIVGNRYCGNIGRQHRSNNIKLVVDINARCFYQKCYDPDCATYRSESRILPSEIQFHLDDEFDVDLLSSNISFETSSLNYNDVSDEELAEVANVVEEILCEAINNSY